MCRDRFVGQDRSMITERLLDRQFVAKVEHHGLRTFESPHHGIERRPHVDVGLLLKETTQSDEGGRFSAAGQGG